MRNYSRLLCVIFCLYLFVCSISNLIVVRRFEKHIKYFVPVKIETPSDCKLYINGKPFDIQPVLFLSTKIRYKIAIYRDENVLRIWDNYTPVPFDILTLQNS